MSCLLRICGHSFSWALFTFLLLGHVQALAEWVALDAHHQSHGLQTVYIDLSTLRRDGQLATMVTLIDWKWMQGNRSPMRFYSTTLTKQFDCMGNRMRLLAFTDFYGHMGTGRRVASYESEASWSPIEPESLNHVLWEMACRRG